MTVLSITTAGNEGFAQLVSQGEVCRLLKSSWLAESSTDFLRGLLHYECQSCIYDTG